MFLLTTTLVLSLLGLRVLADAVSCNDTALGITAIEAGFANASIVPDLLPSFNASAVMNVAFPVAGLISPGQNLSTQQVATAPNVTITPANSSVPATGNYTLMMVDAGAAGTNESSGQVLHWLANFATLQNDSSPCPSLNVSTNGGLVVTNFVSPQPPAGTGLHRYVILLFLQPPSFSPPANFSSPNIGIDLKFNFTDYVSSSNFTQPIAGMFFERAVQQGPVTVTIPPTSLVVTSTLIPTTPASSA
ncbi:phosphatidylethanolamine-binding protein [Russula emetica]|nr:phosphatidylethanolamine-binding protein [Russula emetica]